MLTASLAACLVLLLAPGSAAQEPRPTDPTNPPPCATAHIAFDASSVEKIFLRPEDVLADTDTFWQQDGAYKLARLWHERNKIPIRLDEWREHLNRIASTRAAERSTHPVFVLSKELIDNRVEFMARALPHICSFLPDAAVSLDTTVYLTAYTSARGFMTNSNIVINIMDPYWHADRQHLLNAIEHELFHIGYGRNSTSLALASRSDDPFYAMLRPLHNEGMATYVAYTVATVLPATNERDYELLASPADVVELRHRLNALLEESKTLSPDERQKRSWAIGVNQRAYYVVGADMARTIDARAGRKALVDTITNGPRGFVASYNALVPPTERVVELP